MINRYNGKEMKDPECIERAVQDGLARKTRPKVLIRCITYNQEKYVEETLTGFVSQKTDFPFLAIVHDDASTDGTASVIQEFAKRYPDVIIPICDKVNRHTEKSLGFLLDEIIDAYRPEYIAICEGDDYWTDESKLQKQVDYLDSHADCVMCHGDYELTDGSQKREQPHYDDEPYFGPGHIHTYHISTLTTLYRYDAYKRIPNHRNDHDWLMGDYPLWIELSREGKFHYIPSVMGKYRVLPNSYSHSTNGEKIKAFWESTDEVTRFYSELYAYKYQPRPRKSLYFEIQKQCYKNNDKDQARKYWKEARSCHARSLKSFLFYFCNVFNMRWLMKLVYSIIK